MRYLGYEVWYGNILKNYFFIEDCAILPARKFGYKKRNLLGVKLGERGPQNHFCTGVVKTAA
jgi:hypothetical protein